MLNRYYYDGFGRDGSSGTGHWKQHLSFLEDMRILPSGLDGYATLTREIAVYAVVSCIADIEGELVKLNYEPVTEFSDSGKISIGFYGHVNFQY